MKFERVDDKTVRCFISNEELEDYQIDYKDFVMRSDKAREIVRDIIAQASETVGYKPPKFAFDLSIMMLPEQGLVLTFSESDPLFDKNGGKLMEYLKEMKEAISKASGTKTSNIGKDAKKASEKQDAMPKQPSQGIFVFQSLGQVMEFANAVPRNLRVHSELYRMKDCYYLYLEKGTAAYLRYSKLCVQAMEFGDIYGADDQKLLFLQEHGVCLIAEGALKKLNVETGAKKSSKK